MPSKQKKSSSDERKTLIGGNSESLGRTFLGLHKTDRKTINGLVERLTSKEQAAPDANRTGANKEMGIFNSFACKGW